MGFQEDIEAILEEHPDRPADAAVLGHGARGDPAAGPAVPAQPRVPEAVGGLRRRARDPARLLRHPGRQPRGGAAAGAGVREPGEGHRLLQHPGGDRAGGGVPAPPGVRGRGHLVGPVAGRSGEGDGAGCAPGASASWWPPTWPPGASTSRPCPTSSTTPSRSRPRCTSTAPGGPGRAGRHGTAISLIGPTEVGAFYYVKLLYKIRPEERSLPSEAEIRSKREGERIQPLRDRFAEEPAASWRSLARRVMTRHRRREADRLAAGGRAGRPRQAGAGPTAGAIDAGGLGGRAAPRAPTRRRPPPWRPPRSGSRPVRPRPAGPRGPTRSRPSSAARGPRRATGARTTART